MIDLGGERPARAAEAVALEHLETHAPPRSRRSLAAGVLDARLRVRATRHRADRERSCSHASVTVRTWHRGSAKAGAVGSGPLSSRRSSSSAESSSSRSGRWRPSPATERVAKTDRAEQIRLLLRGVPLGVVCQPEPQPVRMPRSCEESWTMSSRRSPSLRLRGG